MKCSVFFVFLLLVQLVSCESAGILGKKVVKVTVADPVPGGFWRTKYEWKARWVKEWREQKVWKATWKKVWSPVEVKEWVPLPKTPPASKLSDKHKV